jgi:hypothetical protein
VAMAAMAARTMTAEAIPVTIERAPRLWMAANYELFLPDLSGDEGPEEMIYLA